MTDIGTIVSILTILIGILVLSLFRFDKKFYGIYLEINRSEERIHNHCCVKMERIVDELREIKEIVKKFQKIEEDTIDLDKRVIVLETVRDCMKNEPRTIMATQPAIQEIRKRRGRPPSRPL